VGENLAIDFSSSQGVMEAWDNSPLHKKNLLSPYYQEIGVADVSGKFQGQDTTVVVQIFGAPATATVQPLSPASSQLNSNLNLPEINLAGSQFSRAENLLTHSIITQESVPSGLKLILPAENNTSAQANKFFIQPETEVAISGILIIFIFFTSLYLMLFLHLYYFQKINKLISI